MDNADYIPCSCFLFYDDMGEEEEVFVCGLAAG